MRARLRGEPSVRCEVHRFPLTFDHTRGLWRDLANGNPFAFVIHSFSVWTAPDCASGHNAGRFPVASGHLALAAGQRAAWNHCRLLPRIVDEHVRGLDDQIRLKPRPVSAGEVRKKIQPASVAD